jgi:uroporphyrinogen decarboxylase
MSYWWEDMCFNNGPLLAPSYIDAWMVPRYKRITDMLRNEFGCRFNMLDCDGKINDVAGLWQNGGINCMFPLESAHTDLQDLSARFGTRMPMRGGFDKRALIAGKEAIDREFERLEPLYRKGGFIPHTDHLVPPDVSWENYLYYRKKKCEMIGKEFVLPN